MPRAAKDSGATVESLLASVRAAHFTRTSGFREGYDAGEVDTFLGALEVAFGRRSPVDRLIASVEFTPVRVRPGYDTSEVDAFLADIDERAAAAPLPTSVRPETPESSSSEEAIALVQGARFTTVRRLGYKIDQVDALLDQLVEALRSGSPLQNVLDRRSPSRTLVGEGYAVNEVEHLLTSLGLRRPDFASTGLDPDPPAARERSAPSPAPEEPTDQAKESAEKQAEEPAEQPAEVPAEESVEEGAGDEHETTSVLDDFLTHAPPKPTKPARRKRRSERAEPETTPEPVAEPVAEPTVELDLTKVSESEADPDTEPTVVLDLTPTTPARSFEVTMHAVDPAALCAFWCEVLGYQVDPADQGEAAGDQPSVAVPPAGDGPRVRFAPIPRRRGGLVRTRLDVVVAPGLRGPEQMEAVTAEAARLVTLGAGEVERREPADEHATGHVVLRDPEGNEFALR